MNGFVRATEDVDILIDVSKENVTKLIDVLKNWGEGYAKELSIEDFPLSPGAVRIIESFPLDIFTILNGKNYSEYLINSNKNNSGILYLNPESLIETKQNTYREKDKIDIIALNSILKDNK